MSFSDWPTYPQVYLDGELLGNYYCVWDEKIIFIFRRIGRDQRGNQGSCIRREVAKDIGE